MMGTRLGESPQYLGRGGGGVLPHIGYIGMCRCEVYGFQAVYSGTGIQIREFGSRIAYHFPGN